MWLCARSHLTLAVILHHHYHYRCKQLTMLIIIIIMIIMIFIIMMLMAAWLLLSPAVVVVVRFLDLNGKCLLVFASTFTLNCFCQSVHFIVAVFLRQQFEIFHLYM